MLNVFHARNYRDIVGDPLKDTGRATRVQPLRFTADGMPDFGLPLPEGSGEAMTVIALSTGAPNVFDGESRLTASAAAPRAPNCTPTSSPTPARGRALVYAGGGYLQLMHDKEGVEIAQWLNTLGLDAYVLVHRLPGQDGQPLGHRAAGRPAGAGPPRHVARRCHCCTWACPPAATWPA